MHCKTKKRKINKKGGTGKSATMKINFGSSKKIAHLMKQSDGRRRRKTIKKRKYKKGGCGCRRRML